MRRKIRKKNVARRDDRKQYTKEIKNLTDTFEKRCATELHLFDQQAK